MKILTLIVVFVSILASTLPRQSEASDPISFAFELEGEELSYLIFLPASFDSEKTYWPLVQFRRAGNAFEEAESLRLNGKVDETWRNDIRPKFVHQTDSHGIITSE